MPKASTRLDDVNDMKTESSSTHTSEAHDVSVEQPLGKLVSVQFQFPTEIGGLSSSMSQISSSQAEIEHLDNGVLVSVRLNSTPKRVESTFVPMENVKAIRYRT